MTKFIVILLSNIVFLLGCTTKSGRLKETSSAYSQVESSRQKSNSAKENVVRMIKENGVYKIPVTINGVDMVFIFDTGAGFISISNVEASYLYKQGKLTREDILGQEQFSDANGTISVGTIIKLKEVSIGNKTIYNINASVVDNAIAPLLFGQSALERFGKISIDYKAGTVTFE